jgi:hypothetical protein
VVVAADPEESGPGGDAGDLLHRGRRVLVDDDLIGLGVDGGDRGGADGDDAA